VSREVIKVIELFYNNWNAVFFAQHFGFRINTTGVVYLLSLQHFTLGNLVLKV